jgi:hypothetical protein
VPPERGDYGDVVARERTPDLRARQDGDPGAHDPLDEPASAGELIIGPRTGSPPATGGLLEVLPSERRALVEKDHSRTGLGSRRSGRQTARTAADDEEIWRLGEIRRPTDGAASEFSGDGGEIGAGRLTRHLQAWDSGSDARALTGAAVDGDHAFVAHAHATEDAAALAAQGLAQPEFTRRE